MPRDEEKTARRLHILAVAQELFSNRTYENISMDLIAKTAGITKRTIYQYFPSKEALYFELALIHFRRIPHLFRRAIAGVKGGLKKIELLGSTIYNLINDSQDTFRVIKLVRELTHTGHLQIAEWQEIENATLSLFQGVMTEGQADGSIRSDIDPRSGALMFFFLISGFTQFMNDMGRRVLTDFDIPEDMFITTYLKFCHLTFAAKHQS